MQNDGRLVRNPGDCTCNDGGYIHQECLTQLAKHTTDAHRIAVRYSESLVIVTCVHAPCGKRMPVHTMPLPQHRKFLEYLALQWAVFVTKLYEDEDPWYLCLETLVVVGTLMAALRLTLLRVAFLVLVMVVPFHPSEIVQRPDLVRIALYSVAATMLLPRTELSTKLLVVYAVAWRAWSRRQYIAWVHKLVQATLA